MRYKSITEFRKAIKSIGYKRFTTHKMYGVYYIRLQSHCIGIDKLRLLLTVLTDDMSIVHKDTLGKCLCIRTEIPVR